MKTKPTEHVFAAALVLACALQLVDHFLPKVPVFPWLKLGLSHLIILPFLLRYGVRAALALALGRNALTFLVAGTPFTSMLVGMLAAMVSVGMVGGLLRPLVRRGGLGWLGLGVASAIAHNAAQLVLVESLLIEHSGFYFQLAPLALWSLFSGALVALLAAAAMPFWNRLFAQHSNEFVMGYLSRPKEAHHHSSDAPNGGFKKSIGWWAWFSVAVVALCLPGLIAQGACFFAVALFTLALTLKSGGSISTWFRPIRGAWVFLLFMAWLHLMHGEGNYLEWPAWLGRLGVTQQGLLQFGVVAFRLLTLALVGPELLRHFPRAWLERSSSPLARGFCLALPALLTLPSQVPKALGLARQAMSQAAKQGSGPGYPQRFGHTFAVFAEAVLISTQGDGFKNRI